MYDQLQVGRIVSTQGIKGEVRVIPLTDNASRFEDLKCVYIENKGLKDKLTIESVKYVKNLVVLKFSGVDTVEKAESLRNAFLLIDRKDAVKLPKDSYFICDLIGLEVFDENGKRLGKLENILHTGSNDVYCVRGDDSGEILLPALKSVVKEISIEKGIINVIIPKGLLEDEV